MLCTALIIRYFNVVVVKVVSHSSKVLGSRKLLGAILFSEGLISPRDRCSFRDPVSPLHVINIPALAVSRCYYLRAIRSQKFIDLLACILHDMSFRSDPDGAAVIVPQNSSY